MSKNVNFITKNLYHAIRMRVRDIKTILGPKEELMIGKSIADFGAL